MTFEGIASVITLLGLGGLLGTYFRIIWERKNSALLQKQEFKETRYKCVIILLLAYLDFQKNKAMLQMHGREHINSIEDLKDELILEWNNMILFASEEVLVTMNNFINHPSHDNFKNIAIAMRKDLWDRKVVLKDLDKLFLNQK